MSRILSTVCIAVLAGLSACNEGGLATRADNAFQNEDSAAVYGQVRLDVYPPQENDLRNAQGQLVDLRPQTFFVELTESRPSSNLTLTPAVNMGGQITGRSFTPQSQGDLPTTSGPLADATVSFVLDDTVQAPRTTTDADGLYDVPIVPGDVDYRMVVVPQTPLMPVVNVDLSVDGRSSTQDLHIEPGVPLWGRVHRPNDSGLDNVSVRAIDADGVQSAAAITDEKGRYVIMVQPGRSYSVRAERFPHVPTVLVPSVEVGQDGRSVDVPYATPVHGTVVGRVGAASGSSPNDNDLRVTLRAISLTGYDDVRATHELELRTSDLVFTSVVPQGTYEVEIAPLLTDRFAPVTVGTIEVQTNAITDVGQIDLEEMSSRFGEVVDNANDPVAGASVTCAEVGYAGRSWSTTTDVDGAFIFTTPGTVDMRCTVAPSANRPDLALSRQTLDKSVVQDAETRWTLVASRGASIEGQVRARRSVSGDGEPLSNAVIEVRNDAGLLLGIAVSDQDGMYSLQVAP